MLNFIKKLVSFQEPYVKKMSMGGGWQDKKKSCHISNLISLIDLIRHLKSSKKTLLFF